MVTTQPPADVEARLRAHFARYSGGSSFDFLRDDWAPRVEHYLKLLDVPLDDLVKEARSFYADKSRVALKVRAGSVQTRYAGDRTTATFVLSMAWSRRPPPAARACGHLDADQGWVASSTIDRQVDVNAEMTLNAAGRFVAYDEHGLVPVHLRAKAFGDPLRAFASMPAEPARDADEDTSVASIPDGTVVDDLGESFTCGLSAGEVDTVEKVRFQGREVWVLSGWMFDTGHSYVGTDTLVAAP